MFVCCKAAEESCACMADFLCPANRPSPIFTLYAWITNIIVIIITAVHWANDSGKTCNSNTKTWNGVIFAICGVNMLFAIYLYLRFTQKIQSGQAAGKAANQLFMYDFGVYFYFWFVIFEIVWVAISGTYNNTEIICTNLSSTGIVTTFIVLFIVGGFFVMVFSLFTECCREPKWAGETGTQNYQNRPQSYARMGGQQQQAAPAQQHVYAQPAPAPAPTGGYGAPPPATNPAYGQPAPYGGQQGGGTYAQPQQQQQGGIRGKVNNVVGKIF